MDSVDVFKLIEQVQALTEQNRELMEAAKAASESSSGFSTSEVILALIGLVGGVWGVVELVIKNKSKKDLSEIDASTGLKTKIINNQAEADRVFQQTMVQTTQESFINIVNSLWDFLTNFLVSMNESISQLSERVQRVGSIAETLNKRMITHDKMTQSSFNRLEVKLDNIQSHIAELEKTSFVSIKEFSTKDDLDVSSEDNIDNTSKGKD